MSRKPITVLVRLTRYTRKGVEKRVLFYDDSAVAVEDGKVYLAAGWKIVHIEMLGDEGPGPGRGVQGTITMRPHTKRDRERYAATAAAMSDA